MPEVAAARAWEALAEVRTLHPQVRWLPQNKLHLTLVFLGPTDPGRVESISAAVARVARSHQSFDVATGDAGGRLGGRGGGVAWLRLADGGRDVGQLSLELDDAIGAHRYDANNAPRPHLTVARGASEDALVDLRHAADTLRITWSVDRAVLFRSHTDPRGSRYEELTSASLSA